MNLYRGCLHGCIYCDSRSLCYDFKHDFTDIEIKENALEILEQELLKKKKKCMLGTGSMTDPYMSIENKYEYTRKSLLLALKYDFGFSFITKSANCLRDLNLIKEINNKTKCVVQMTLTTYDETLCKILEPNVSTTKERFEALKVFRDNNIPTIVWLSPILPFINDTLENLKGILNYCVEAKVYGILLFDFGLTLREGNREYFFQNLDKYFPNLKEKYIKIYGNSYSLRSPNADILLKEFKKVCQENKIEIDVNKIFTYLNTLENKKEIFFDL
ncbi:MAG: radical SAM protein [Bacillales bacterium]|nr:radical SAM protein [Bacillales bacterium]